MVEETTALQALPLVVTDAWRASFPDAGLGVAVKCDDGATRAAEVIMAALIARFCALSDGERASLEPFLRPTLHNWNGLAVAALRPTELVLGQASASKD